MKFTPPGVAAVGYDLTPPFVVDVSLDPVGDLSAQRQTELRFITVARVLPGRRVSGLAEHEGRTVFAKLFYGKRALHYWQRELRGARRMAHAQITTPGLLAQGASADGSGFVVFYEALEDVHNLRDDDIEDVLAATQILARLHDANLIQSDVHIFNFLRCLGNYFAIDADGIRSAYLPRQHFRNLAMFLAQRRPVFDRDVDEVWSVYSASRGAYVSRMGSTALVAKLIRQQRRQRVRRYLKKTQRECTEFVRHRSWRHNFLCDRAHWQRLQRFMLFAEDMMAEGIPLKLGNSSTVVRIEVAGHGYVVKRYNLKSSWHRIRRLFKRRARDAWRNGHHLAFLGVDTAKPVALLETKWGWLTGVCYLVMPDVGSQDLGQVLAAQPEAFDRYAGKTVGLLENLAAAGLRHGDLKATNFVLAQDRVVLIDYDAVQAGSLDKDVTRFLRNWQDVPDLHHQWSMALAPLQVYLEGNR